MFSILKEKKNLDRHGFRLPSITHTYKLNDLYYIYPVARSIHESIRTFNYTSSKIDERFKKLVAAKRNDV